MGDKSVVTMLLFAMLLGSLAFPAKCRPQLLDSRSSIATTINSTSVEERKMSLIFCVAVRCSYFNPDYGDCYCCPNAGRREYCHLTMKDCRDNCASCKPKCSQ
ncbi:hypothetical protein EJB05_18339 [Eragrostis curvula]|uniref:Meg domain-containing protein n=1 Tax=Eragrostis curvula TaxID=38414 RepID=A0A5J9VLS1_9POAL|nr:hypothetical protein EJB05_18339 [Eragrostis curvula]